MNRLQIILPFFIAGIGTCFAGIILGHVQYWKVFAQVEELFLLLPALLGLKGNLQMTLASRFSTHSHLGHLQTLEDLLGLTCANLSLNQCLSIVISFSASILVTIIHLITSGEFFDGRRILLITATALLTSSVTSFLLDILMILVVHVSAQFNINPDNIATPIAASLGDMTALLLCSMLARLFHTAFAAPAFYGITVFVILFYLMLIPIWMDITQENIHTASIIQEASHWYPLITAMVISTISGIVLKLAVAYSDYIALFQPVICGVGGNLVAVQASRLSTTLHREEARGTLPEGESVCMDPCHIFTSEKPAFAITRLLIAIVVPGQIVFYFLCIYLNSRNQQVSVPFLLCYLTGSEVQVIVLLYLAHVLTFLLWKLDIDPDNCIIPYLTSISDLLGACIITLICILVLPANLNPPPAGKTISGN